MLGTWDPKTSFTITVVIQKQKNKLNTYQKATQEISDRMI